MDKAKFPKTAGKYLIELIIVFVGVYSAFLLNQYKVDAENEAKRIQITEGLINEISGIIARTERVSHQIPKVSAYYDSLIAAGEKPIFKPTIEPVRVEAHMWKASLEAGVIDLFEIPVIFKISEFYNSLNAGFEQIEQLRYLSETILIPNLDKGVNEFYEPDTGEPKLKYQWYLSGLKTLTGIAGEITSKGKVLLEILNTSKKH